MGHLACFVVEEHTVEPHRETAKGEYREGDGGDELAVDARVDELDEWQFWQGNSLSEEPACWQWAVSIAIR
ncbi:hypothetical protein M9Y57_18815 [Pseudomonas putida]|nr:MULTISPECIES: hypothetical protein [Pseudomonas]MCL8306930.1 hypothetical protein [Pseudomonas putida]